MNENSIASEDETLKSIIVEKSVNEELLQEHIEVKKKLIFLKGRKSDLK